MKIEIWMPIPVAIYPVVGLLDHKVVLFFKFFEDLYTVFYYGCTNLQSHQQCTSVLFSYPHPHQHLLSFVILIKAFIAG
jgi:hypothetical protein